MDRIFRLLAMRASLALGTVIVAAVTAVVGVCFLLAAGYMFLCTLMEPALAALSIGIATLVISFVTATIGWRLAAGPDPALAPSESGGTAPPPGARPTPDPMQLADAASRFTRENPGMATFGALAVGVMLGISRTSRRAASDLLHEVSTTRQPPR
ncbi:hypothetical protein [Oceanibacterium hippocampi]|uniref:Uncharacterized protein n=1 Tax=Oceanibacterium hippocampi TaxID=745714 RepID=A0A1Y5TVH3_9PROT|nr:hypothetical protein [Oceanibacterium hippocampi]SLN73736.1 hypothetical protein OCH7691_03650 [Oceanibacterium hippocampi]